MGINSFIVSLYFKTIKKTTVMDKKIKLAPTVILVDAAYLNFMLINLKDFLEHQLKRKLDVVPMADLITYIAQDAQIEEGEKEIQVIFISEDSKFKFHHTDPSHLNKELDGVAFKSSLGEFLFSSVFSEGIVSREELFLDILSIALDSQDVKKLIVLSFDDEYGGDVMKKLNHEDVKQDIIQFRMRQPETKVKFKWDMLVFPLMKAFGVSSNEISI